MKLNLMTAGTLALTTLSATGCIASHKYVARTVAPVEARVTTTEAKNSDQDKALASQSGQIEKLETNLSRTNEKVGDADAKAVAAQQAANRAGERADGAQRAADAAQTSARGAQSTAERSLAHTDEVGKTLEKKVDAANTFQMATSETVLFKTGQYKLDDDAKAKLTEIAARSKQNPRFIVEIQGFTDKTGSPETNAVLSQKRAEAVTRYLINEHQIPLRNIDMIGSGYASPVADDKTRDGRKMNRRVEVRLFVPQISSASETLTASSK